MSEGKLYPFEDLPDEYFSGGSHLAKSPDDLPDLYELFNRLRAGGGGAKTGRGTVTAGQVTKAITFPAAFPAGATVRVLVSGRANVNMWATSEAITGFTANISGALGADMEFAWVAFAV